MKLRMLLESLVLGGLVTGLAMGVSAQNQMQDETASEDQQFDSEEMAEDFSEDLPEDTEEMETPEDQSGLTFQDSTGLGDNLSVELSVQELQQLLDLPQGALIKEWQEDLQNPKSIFSTQEDMRRIFGDEKPPFIYFPDGVDPMVIPWVRERVIAEELFQEANMARNNRDFEKAKTILRGIQEEYPNTAEGQKAPGLIAEIDNQLERERQQELAQQRGPEELQLPAAPQQVIELPRWVRQYTTGVLIGDDGIPVVVVGNDFLRPGDPVPRYSSVRVKSIAPSEVVYVYQEKEFPVEVVGAF